MKTGIRILLRFRLYSVINIIGLAVSLACVIIIARYVYQETTVNHFIDHLERVSLVAVERENRPPFLGNAAGSADFESPLKDPSIELTSSFIPFHDEQIMVDDHRYAVKMFVVDTAFLQIIPYPVLLGSDKLQAPEDAVITARLAKRLFGDSSPIGQKIMHTSGNILHVTGVLDEPDTQSSFDFEILVNSQLRRSWLRMPYDIVLLHKGTDVDLFNQKYAGFRSMPHYTGESLTRYQLLPLKDFYFDRSLYLSRYNEEIFHNGNINNILIITIVGVLILLVGLFNFVNIYTVITLRRNREFGIKKVYGARGLRIFGQIYLEIFLLAAIALLGAWFLLEISQGLFFEKFDLVLHSTTLFNLLFSLALLVILPLITTIYPYLRYNYSVPVSSLRSVNVGGVSLVSRTIFLFLQYVITFGLIVVSLYFMKQLRFMLHSDVGYDTEDIVVCKVLYQDNFHDFRNESESEKRQDYFTRVTETIERKMDASPLFLHWVYGTPSYSQEPYLRLSVDNGEIHNVGMLYTSRRQMVLYNYQLLEGRLWDSTDIALQYRFIINETAKKIFKINDIHSSYLQPEHRLWTGQGDMTTNPAYEIIGVVKDFNTGHLSNPTIPMVIAYQEEYMKDENIMAKIAPGKRAEAIEYLKELNRELYGEADFTYGFMVDEIAAIYAEDKRVSRIYTTFSLIAIIISCLGLFALSLFDIRQRYREIALRKINGAGARDIIRLLLKKYIYLLVGSFLVAIPVSYLVINRYMENFVHKTPVSWWLFAVSAIGVTAISLLTLVWQVRKAIGANPVQSLKSE